MIASAAPAEKPNNMLSEAVVCLRRCTLLKERNVVFYILIHLTDCFEAYI